MNLSKSFATSPKELKFGNKTFTNPKEILEILESEKFNKLTYFANSSGYKVYLLSFASSLLILLNLASLYFITIIFILKI